MGAQGGHKARPYSANDALATYTAVQIRYRICAVDHLAYARFSLFGPLLLASCHSVFLHGHARANLYERGFHGVRLERQPHEMATVPKRGQPPERGSGE